LQEPQILAIPEQDRQALESGITDGTTSVSPLKSLALDALTSNMKNLNLSIF